MERITRKPRPTRPPLRLAGFGLTGFMRAAGLAAVGEAAAREQVPKIRQLLARLDPQLFPVGQ
jgi:hypothetical protein